jgi:formylglycine-generating enzyme required for sulfatase activity
MGETEVTNKLWEAVMGYNPTGSGLDANKPVRNVTWIEAIVFCNKLSIKAGREPVYNVNIPYHKTCLLPWQSGPEKYQKWKYEVPEKDKQGYSIDDAWVDNRWSGKTRADLEVVVYKANEWLWDGGTWVNNDDYWPPFDPEGGCYGGWEEGGFPSTPVYDYNDDPGGFKTLIAPLHDAIKDTTGWLAFNVGTGLKDPNSDWPFYPEELLNLTRQERSDGWYDGWDIPGKNANKVDPPPNDVPRISYYDEQGTLHHYEIEIISINKNANDGYRLPAHQQWMWAAMGADMSPAKLSNVEGFTGVVNALDYTKPFAGYNGYNNIADYVWFSDTVRDQDSSPQAVGTKKPNELGIYDLSGNVGEWCYDQWAGVNYYSFPAPGGINYYVPKPMRDDDHYMTSTFKVLQGGSYTSTIPALTFGYYMFNNRETTEAARGDQGLRVMRWVQLGE